MTQKEFFKALEKSNGFSVHQTTGTIRRRLENATICPICHLANRKLKKRKFSTEAKTAGNI